jgi:hypothetical protein
MVQEVKVCPPRHWSSRDEGVSTGKHQLVIQKVKARPDHWYSDSATMFGQGTEPGGIGRIGR